MKLQQSSELATRVETSMKNYFNQSDPSELHRLVFVILKRNSTHRSWSLFWETLFSQNQTPSLLQDINFLRISNFEDTSLEYFEYITSPVLRLRNKNARRRRIVRRVALCKFVIFNCIIVVTENSIINDDRQTLHSFPSGQLFTRL